MDWTQLLTTLISFIPDILALIGCSAVAATVTPHSPGNKAGALAARVVHAAALNFGKARNER
jgi:hypothetical protein